MAEPEEILSIIGSYRREADTIVDSVNELGFYMQGYSRDDLFAMSYRERTKLTKLIDKIIEKYGKAGFAYP